jgi:hypothetical protein
MKQVIYDCKTKITTIIEVPDEPITPIGQQPPTTEEVLAGLIDELVEKGVIG